VQLGLRGFHFKALSSPIAGFPASGELTMFSAAYQPGIILKEW
jgi:hypothetical protein